MLGGVDVFVCAGWGPLDEASSGTSEMHKRYGHVYVYADDFGNGTYACSGKKSFCWYKKVIAANGADPANDIADCPRVADV